MSEGDDRERKRAEVDPPLDRCSSQLRWNPLWRAITLERLVQRLDAEAGIERVGVFPTCVGMNRERRKIGVPMAGVCAQVSKSLQGAPLGVLVARRKAR